MVCYRGTGISFTIPLDEARLGGTLAAHHPPILHQDAVRQHRAGEALHVFRDDEVAAAAPSPAPDTP